MSLARELPDFVTSELTRLADPEKAAGMAAYMKSEMPCFGVPKPPREKITREIHRRYDSPSRRELERTVRALWKRPHREEKYVAIAVAQLWPDRITPESVPLYERLIREGAWWDFVDEIAIRLVGRAWREDPRTIAPVMDSWIDDDDLWIRRTAIIAQVSAKEATDWRRLSRYCRRRMHEKEFFIRKGIGWALRSYSYVSPDRVLAFLDRHREEMSGLSFREGAKALRRVGYTI